MHSQSRTFRRWTACALLAALGSAAQAHAAVYSGSVISRANAVGFGTVIQPPDDATDQIAATPFAALNSSNEANQTWVDGSVSALAAGNSDSSSNTSTGALQLYANAIANVDVAGIAANTNASGSSHAAGFFRDVLVFDVPNAAAGAQYSVRASIRIDAVNTSAGTLVEVAPPSFSNASSEWSTRVSMATGAGWLFQEEGSAQCSYLITLDCSGDEPGSTIVSFSVGNQDLIVFEMSGDVSATAGVLIAAEGIGNAGSTSANTLAWDGVLDVSDSLGNPVSEFSLVGLDSGHDFREPVPVPEPDKLMLQLAATAAIALRRRIARRTQRGTPKPPRH